MKLRTCAIVIAALGISAPVFAQSSTAGSTAASQNVGASGVNETTGTSNPKNVKAQGSGSGGADVGASTTTRKRSDRATTGSTGAATGATGGTSGANVGASGVNETTGPSSSQGVKPQGSGSGSRY